MQLRQATVDMVHAATNDIRGSVLGLPFVAAADRRGMLERCFQQTLPKYLAPVEQLLRKVSIPSQSWCMISRTSTRHAHQTHCGTNNTYTRCARCQMRQMPVLESEHAALPNHPASDSPSIVDTDTRRLCTDLPKP